MTTPARGAHLVMAFDTSHAFADLLWYLILVERFARTAEDGSVERRVSYACFVQWASPRFGNSRKGIELTATLQNEKMASLSRRGMSTRPPLISTTRCQ